MIYPTYGSNVKKGYPGHSREITNTIKVGYSAVGDIVFYFTLHF